MHQEMTIINGITWCPYPLRINCFRYSSYITAMLTRQLCHMKNFNWGLSSKSEQRRTWDQYLEQFFTWNVLGRKVSPEKQWKPHRFTYLKWLDRAVKQCCRKLFSIDNSEAASYLTAGVSAWYPLNLSFPASLTSEDRGLCDTRKRPLGLEATKWHRNTSCLPKASEVPLMAALWFCMKQDLCLQVLLLLLQVTRPLPF